MWSSYSLIMAGTAHPGTARPTATMMSNCSGSKVIRVVSDVLVAFCLDI